MVISGTGFHYGRALVSYNPLSGYDEVTVTRNFLQADLVAASQKPHFFLNPSNNSGGQLDLPFFWQRNYLSLSRPDSADMGQITIKGLTNLLHANGGNDSVTITVYAWASDVVLTMPTSATTLTALDYQPQAGTMNSGDEYGKGIISKPASALAQAAGALTSVPAIAPYARATEMCARAVGETAALWGYSRPPIVSDTMYIKPNPTGNMANTDAPEALTKLTLDSKQELTVDSRTVGLDGEDQMDIVRFCQRESYLDTFIMNQIETPDTLLWNCKVTPVLYRVEQQELHPTPMAYMSTPFGNWQGTIKYRFQIVKSNFHKGRILIRWDPRSHGANVEYNTVYSRVVDIAEEDDFEISIGWGQQDPFLRLDQMVPGSVPYSDTDRIGPSNNQQYNGVLEIAVLNELVSPALDTPIYFNVFVSTGDDIKFGDVSGTAMKALSLFPTPAGVTTNDYEPQSGVVDALAISGTSEGDTDVPTGAESIAPIAATTQVADQTMNVFFGERITSLRQLFRRYVRHKSYAAFATARAIDVTRVQLREPGLGYWPGWDPFGVDTEQGNPCNISIPTFAQFFMPCYAGWRGSTRAKYTFGGDVGNNPVVVRGNKGYSFSITALDATDPATLGKALTARFAARSAAGAATTNIGINDTVEVEVPYYEPVRFTTAREPNGTFFNGAAGTYVDAVTNGTVDTSLVINSWKSVGEDFTLFFFTGCPILYRNEIVLT